MKSAMIDHVVNFGETESLADYETRSVFKLKVMLSIQIVINFSNFI